MIVPHWVTAGYVDPAQQSARYRCEQLAKRLRRRFGSAHPASEKLSRLCEVYTYPGPFPETPTTLARRLRRLRSTLYAIFGQGYTMRGYK